MSDKRFLVTARKYRPQRFAELVAQEHVTGTLKNAVRLDRLAHAYLFSGPRGVGKTTAARILAKAINCTTPQAERLDGAEPCRTCESCRSFEEGRNLNIIEIDAASNNGVGDVRDLRETVRIPPQGNRKKVYIVDEVHMMSTAAFNALLKTLEEPPPFVLFIFATTEPHKVLATIQSRCQRFDFRRIPVPDIVEQLRSICATESITADDGSLVLIARRGDGALRDALSVFDQAVSLCGEHLALSELSQALGIVGEDLYFEATDRIAASDPAGVLKLVDRIVRAGYDLQEFLDGLAEHVRNLLVALTMPDTNLIEASQETRRRYGDSASTFTEPHLLRLLSLVDRALEELRVSRQPRLRLELALLQMASLPSQVDLRNVLARIDALAAAAPAAPPVVSSAAPPAVSQAPADAPPFPRAAPAPPPSVSPAPPPSVSPAAPPDDSPAPAPPPAPGVQSSVSPGVPPGDDEEDRSDESWTPPPGPSLFDEPPVGRASTTTPETVVVRSRPTGSLGAPALRIDRPRGADSLEGRSPAVETGVAEAEAGEPPAYWDEFVELVKEERRHVGALLTHAVPRLARDKVLVLAVPDEFHVRVLRDEAVVLERCLVTLSGGESRTFRVVLLDRARDEDPADVLAIDPHEAIKALCEEYPALRSLMERFGGEIVW